MEFVNSEGQKADFLGRSDYKGKYHDKSYGLESPEKQEDRERVLEFISRWFPQDDCIRLLSMPGLDWTFERMLLKSRPMSQIVGLEHSYSAFMRSRRAIPGVEKAQRWDESKKLSYLSEDQAELSDRGMKFGTGDILYSRRSSRKSNKSRRLRANRLLFMRSDTFATMLTTDYGASMNERTLFADKFYHRNAAWLDFTSQFCASVEKTIANLHFCMSVGDPKPVVITTMNARDGVSGVEARVKRILDCQPLFTYWDSWTYPGKNGTPMLTICGSIR